MSIEDNMKAIKCVNAKLVICILLSTDMGSVQ